MRRKTVARKNAEPSKKQRPRQGEQESPSKNRKWQGAEEEASPKTRTRSKRGEPSVPLDDPSFKSLNYRKLFVSEFGARGIAPGRPVDFNALDKYNAGFVRKWFQYQGWDGLLKESYPIYPDLVRQFYTHFDQANKDPSVIHTWVKGKTIAFNDVELGEILDLPARGHFHWPGNKWGKYEGFHPTEAIRRVLNDNDYDGEKKPSMDSLPMQSRLLHLILMQTFICRNGRKSSLTYLDMEVIDCILVKRRMNMPKLMIRYMLSAYKNGKGYFLPYGMWLTKVFKYFDVDLSDEVVMANEYKTPFNNKTIENALGYTFDENQKEWKKRGIKRGTKRAEPPSQPSSKKPTSDAAKSQQAELDCLVLQEMLRRMRPDLFTPSTMEDIRVMAMKEMAKRYELENADKGTKEVELEADDGGATELGHADDDDDNGSGSGPNDDDDDDSDGGRTSFDPKDD